MKIELGKIDIKRNHVYIGKNDIATIYRSTTGLIDLLDEKGQDKEKMDYIIDYNFPINTSVIKTTLKGAKERIRRDIGEFLDSEKIKNDKDYDKLMPEIWRKIVKNAKLKIVKPNPDNNVLPKVIAKATVETEKRKSK